MYQMRGKIPFDPHIILYDTGIFSYRQALLFFFERYGKVVNVRTKEKKSVSEYITI